MRERPMVAVIAWGAAYVVAHVLGNAFTDPVRHVAFLWPASGVTFAALLMSPRKARLAVVAALTLLGLVMNVVTYGAVAMSVGFGVTNALDAVLGVGLVTYICRREVTYTRVDEVLATAAAATLVNGATSVLGAASSAAFTGAPFWASYRTWWSGDLLGIVLFAPAIVVWLRAPTKPAPPQRRLERLAFLSAWCTAAWIATSSPLHHGPVVPRPYMLVCLLPWAALRLGLRTVTTAMIVLCAAVVHATRSGNLPGFEGSDFTDAAMPAQLYVSLAALTGLILGASTSEARAAREAADESAGHLTLALDAARMGTWEWSVGADRIHWSDHVMKVFGVTRETCPATFEDYVARIHDEDRADVVGTIQRALQSASTGYTVEHRIVRADGVRWLECRGRVYRDANGQPIRMAGTVADVTEQRQVGERLRQTQKMEAFGQLAGGVAHDFNNLLSVILLQAEIARKTGAVGAEGRPLLEEIVGAAERGASLTKQLLAFARHQLPQSKAVDVDAAVAGVSAMLARLLPEEVRMTVRRSTTPLVVRVDQGMLDQVVVNLALNARDAMTAGGELTIETEAVTLTAAEGEGRESVTPGRYAVIRVSDTGAGIAPEHEARLFEPFFTTKPPGKGTGLGLATVFGIVRLHHGHVRVRSELGQGSTFELLFPLTDDVPETTDASSNGVVPPSAKRHTVLLVEDDERVRKTTRALLEMHDYAVVEAKDGDDALRVWADHADRIDVLFTDMTMPGPLDGRRLAAELRKQRPGLRVVITSGYNVNMGGNLEPGERFLMKPSSLPELLAALEDALRA